MQRVQYSLAVTSLVADSFLGDRLWRQPMAGLCVLWPHSGTGHEFVIVQMGNVEKRGKKGKRRRKPNFYQVHFFPLCALCCVNILSLRCQNYKHWKTGGISQRHSPPAAGANESERYIMQLALAQGTSDGNSGLSPSSRVTHWIWHMPNMARLREFLRNISDLGTVFFSPQHRITV